MKRDDGLVNKLLDKHGWTDVELARESLGGKEEVLADLDGKLAGFRAEQDKLKSGIEALIREKRPELERMWTNLRLNELYARIQSYFSHTTRTMIFSGWLPARTQGPLGEALQRATAGRCYLEWHDPSEMTTAQKAKVPVQLTGPRLLAPFKMLVTNYSIPQYGTVDPTPFVFVAYLAMFGLMFGGRGPRPGAGPGGHPGYGHLQGLQPEHPQPHEAGRLVRRLGHGRRGAVRLVLRPRPAAAAVVQLPRRRGRGAHRGGGQGRLRHPADHHLVRDRGDRPGPGAQLGQPRAPAATGSACSSTRPA